jgi:hypothetical protein
LTALTTKRDLLVLREAPDRPLGLEHTKLLVLFISWLAMGGAYAVAIVSHSACFTRSLNSVATAAANGWMIEEDFVRSWVAAREEEERIWPLLLMRYGPELCGVHWLQSYPLSATWTLWPESFCL